MIKEYTIEYLSTLRFNNLWCALKSGNERWLEVIEYKGLNTEFESWLAEGGLERTIQHAEDFLAYKDKKDYEQQDWEGFLKAKAKNEDSWHYISFYNMLDVQLREHKAKPYKGKLTIGHYVGIKKNVDDDPYQYENHDIGQIEDYKEEPDGHISSYVLSRPDNTEVTVPAEMTYRIY